MSSTKVFHHETNRLIHDLASNDPVQREVARLALVRIGSPEVTVALVGELLDPRQHVRWEAAKALGGLRDPVSAPALLEALDDNNEDVRWVAAEGLIALGRPGLLAAFHGLTKHARSPAFCRSAHHVLHELSRAGESVEIIAPVLNALEQPDSAIAAPPTAFQALMTLKVGSGRAG